ncbi:hypothetical protein GCM10007860_07680 [Chitiniphilus shinanonensis]|uniref:Uncharacterized protein n=3 Tax=Chitiniphilus shinanonensis TaxID=553088 RepID=A0ABQ6BNW3_9NEIS|nr:hypothetical protein GCM10007860_07680 [Chitiniphilus shinanonensis]
MAIMQPMPVLLRRLSLLVLLCLPLSGNAASKGRVPTHFGDRMEAALTCRSEFSTAHWRDYFRTYLGTPLRTWGEAEWFDAQNAVLAGNAAREVFVNLPESGALMVGALIPSPVADVRRNIEQRLSIRFEPLPGPYPRYLSKFGSVLVGLPNRQTKWYCARWHLGNRP